MKLGRFARRQYESKLADDVKSNPTFFVLVRRNRRLKQQIVALRVHVGAVVMDFPNMARILANFYASVYRSDEGRDNPSPPEPSTIMNASHFTLVSVHGALHIRHY